MSANKAQALAAKDRGNAAFTAKKYDEAVQEFTKAIQLDPTDHVFYSNRSGAYASLNKWDEALKDADEALKLKPDFVKGYSRRGVALYNLRRYPEAKSAYEQGLKYDPKSEQMKEGLEQATKAAEAPPKDSNNPFAKMFGPQMWTKLMMDPVTKNYLNDQSYVNKMKMIQANPQLLQGMMQGDPRIQQSLGVLLGLGSQFGEGGEGPQQQGGPGGANSGPTDAEEAEEIQAKPKEKDQEAEKPAESKKPKAKEPEPAKPDTDMTPEDRERAEKRKRADDEKDKGNDLYKKRKFDEAVSHYNKALEIDNTNAAYLSNVAAALFEQKKYEESLDACKRAEKIANENKTSFDIRAKIFGRMGHAYMALKKYGDALSAFDRSLLEENNDRIREAQRKARDLKKKEDDLAYLDPAKATEAKNRGNELFKTGKWVDAITEYSEAIRRDPSNAALYSNRAACYQKIMEWGRALEDCEKCLQLDPKFVKAYIRLGKVQHFLKQYHKAVETYEKGLALDPKNEELLEGLRDTQRVIAAEHVSGKVDPKRAQEAMKDPEIQAILRDPTINKVLGDLKNDPSSAQAALRDPGIQAKLNKLIAAGILGRGKPGEDETGG